MSGTNQFLPFATGAGANVESQADYAADANLPIGNQPGIASSAFNNKAIRQAAYIASQVAQFLVNQTGLNCDDDATPANIQALMTQVWPAPTGTIQMFGAATPPTGFVNCDGSAVSRTTYATLFGVIGTTYGVGDGSTTFNVPNLKGVFAIGAGSQTIGGVSYSGTLGSTVADQMQGHYHSLTDPTHNHTQNSHDHGVPSGITAYVGTSGSPTSTIGSSGGATGVSTNNLTGGAIATNIAASTGITAGSPTTDGTNGTPRTGTVTQPASVGVNYIIKT